MDHQRGRRNERQVSTPDINMPEKEGLVGRGLELDDLHGLEGNLPLKEKQLDARGVAGKDREIHSLRVDSSTQGMGSAGLGLEWSLRCRLPNIGFLLLESISGCHDKLF